MKRHLLISSLLASLLFLCGLSFAQPPAKMPPPPPGPGAKPPKPGPLPPGQFNPQQVKQIENVVHDYLLKNPQVIVQVLRKLQMQQRAAMQKQAINAIHANAKGLFDSPASPVVGNPKAPVTLVEFFDYQCPHCKTMAQAVDRIITKNKNLRVVFKEFPIFPGSMFASKAALAAYKQDKSKYLAFHNALMADKNPLTKNDVLRSASKVGLNVKLLEKDMQSKAIRDELGNNLKLAQTIGLAGTPAFIIQNNKQQNKTFFVPGQVSQQVLQQLIQKAN